MLPTSSEIDRALLRPALRSRLAGVAMMSALTGLLPSPAANAQANKAANEQAIGQSAAAAPSPTNQVDASLLAGKLRFTLTAGFDRTVLPPDGKCGTGAVYLNPKQHQMVLVTEVPTPGGQRVGDDDRAFLDAALAAHLVELDKPVPNYRRLGNKSFSIKGLGLRRTDGRTSFFDKPVYSTSLIAGSGATLATVTIMTPIEDSAGHQTLVASVLDAIAANR